MRPRSRRTTVASLLTSLLTSFPAGATDDNRLPTVAERTTTLERNDGLLTVLFDRARGRIWLRVPPPGHQGVIGEYLYVEGLRTGLGSNPVGLDRGQLGDARVVRLRRLGDRVLLEQVNLAFRADSDDPDERAAVDQSFATSVLWGGAIAALDADGTALVDFSAFVVRDAHGSIEALRYANEGDYTLDRDRSAVDLDSCLVFPDNIELEAILTFTGNQPGPEMQAVAPTAKAVTLVQHQSLIRLPAAGYRRRLFDSRSGSFAIDYADYAAPLAAPLNRRFIVRHRLEKRDPKAAESAVVRPIVYYVDRGVPEPVRSALIEGASWWRTAFAQAGFIDAFRVELLPPDAHPLDVRYNVIQWVHRATRGWSYGGGIIDPRTGEMVKGHVLLGSLRVRHDRLLFEALAGVDKTGTGAADDPIQLALARIRQLAAHEVGHTLGLAHNFAASSFDRGSVMDYPAPRIQVRDGKLDFSDAYAVGVGVWDVQAIRYAHGEPVSGEDEAAMLRAILAENEQKGYLFLSDDDARGSGAAHPLANLWDNGADPIAELELIGRVRRIALDRFGVRNVAVGTPLGTLEDVLAPLYYLHRYQLDAVLKTIAGRDYSYAVREATERPAVRVVDPERQRRALNALIELLAPAQLELPDRLLQQLAPRPFGYRASREQFRGYTQPGFDSLAAAATAADMVVAGLLQPHRCARLVEQHSRDHNSPGLDEVVEALLRQAFATNPAGNGSSEIVGIVQTAVISGLLRLAADTTAPSWVRSRLEERILRLLDGDELTTAEHRGWLARMCGRYIGRTAADVGNPAPAPDPPPGSPIGTPWRSDSRHAEECSFAP